MRPFFVFFWLLLAFPLICGAVTHGLKVGESIHPEAVTIQSEKGQCTASAITSRILITAAHCLENQSAVRVVIAGREWISERSIIHPRYEQNRTSAINDIGLVVFSQNIFDHVASIQASAPTEGQILEFVGFGPGGDLMGITPEVLDDFRRSRGIDTFAIAEKTKRIGKNRYHIVDGKPSVFVFESVAVSPISDPGMHQKIDDNESGFCAGDSGGPVYANGKLVGVSSMHVWGNKPNAKGDEVNINYASMISRDDNLEFILSIVNSSK